MMAQLRTGLGKKKKKNLKARLFCWKMFFNLILRVDGLMAWLNLLACIAGACAAGCKDSLYLPRPGLTERLLKNIPVTKHKTALNAWTIIGVRKPSDAIGYIASNIASEAIPESRVDKRSRKNPESKRIAKPGIKDPVIFKYLEALLIATLVS